MIGWERRVLLRHYLEQGMTKTELAERFRHQQSDDLSLDPQWRAGPRSERRWGALFGPGAGCHQA